MSVRNGMPLACVRNGMTWVRKRMGTVLGPLLFLIYINDLPDSVRHSTTRFFTDDCLMYRNIRSARDTELLQQDMDQLQIWEKDWLMNFNVSDDTLLQEA